MLGAKFVQRGERIASKRVASRKLQRKSHWLSSGKPRIELDQNDDDLTSQASKTGSPVCVCVQVAFVYFNMLVVVVVGCVTVVVVVVVAAAAGLRMAATCLATGVEMLRQDFDGGQLRVTFVADSFGCPQLLGPQTLAS